MEPLPFKIHPDTYPNGTPCFRVDGRWNNVRTRKFFSDATEAEAFCKLKNDEVIVDQSAQSGIRLTPTRLADLDLQAAEAGVSRAAGRWPLGAIIAAGIEKLESARASVKLAPLHAEWLLIAEKNLGDRWYNEVRIRTGFFVKAFPDLATEELTRPLFSKWLDGLDVGRQTKANYRNALHLWGEWLIQRGHYKENPFGGIRLTKKKTAEEKEKMPVVFSPIQAEAYLRACLGAECRRILGWAVLCTLCGLRPENETPNLTWSEINLETGEMHVRGTKKGVKPRYFTVQPMALEWLRLAKKDGLEIPGFSKTYQQITLIRRRAVEIANEWLAKNHPTESPIKWAEDIQRHSFASYRQGQGVAIDKLADEMGTSADTIYSHYKHPRKSADVKRFWEISPFAISS